jgi:hypothetical protein
MVCLDPLADRIPHHDNLVEEQTPDPIIMVSVDRLLNSSCLTPLTQGDKLRVWA